MRSLSGGERLFYRRDGQRVWFASSLKWLLHCVRARATVNPRALASLLATGLPIQRYESAVDGIEEVLAGHALVIQDGPPAQHFFWRGLLTPPEGDVQTLARQFRDKLTNAIEKSQGRERPVAVSLSGGIDSAAVACVAVDAFGADNVVAYTYEFDDVAHGSETAFARSVVKRLGIRAHRVFPIRFDHFLAAIPETVWRAESATYWPKAFMLLLAARLKADGFSRVLSGFGVGSHMATLGAIETHLQTTLKRKALLQYWSALHRRSLARYGNLERLHPALAPTSVRLMFLLYQTLESTHAVRQLMFGERLAALLDALEATTPPNGAIGHTLRDQSFAHLLSCIDVTRWEKVFRELGVERLSPAHFATVLPYAYLPYHPSPNVWSSKRMLRPGKELLRVGFAGDIPDAVRLRKKNWADAIISRRWLRAGVKWMRQVSPQPDAWLPADVSVREKLLQRWDNRSPQATVTALSLYVRLLLQRKLLQRNSEPPSWQELLSAR